MRWYSILCLGLLPWMVGCGGSVDASNGDAGAAGTAGAAGQAGGGQAGQAGSAGTAGGAGSAGTAGTAGTGGGTAGSAGTGGGTGGAAGIGGSAGASGSAGAAGHTAAPECTDASSCTLYSDCCSCVALPPGEDFIPCPALCAIDKCTELGIDPQKPPECQTGQCVVGFDCDVSKAVCAVPPPTCSPGFVPSVQGGCWGPCVRASDCSFVPDCGSCNGPEQVCVSNVAWTAEHHCVDVPPACQGDASCDCMQDAVCLDAFGVCIDGSDGHLSCECPNC